jgi:hypothetical protein
MLRFEARPIKPRLLLEASAPITPSSPAPLRCHGVSPAEHRIGPTVAALSRRPSAPDRTPRATLGIDHQLRTGAELPPLLGDVRRFQRLDSVAGARAHFQLGHDVDIDQAAEAIRGAEIETSSKASTSPLGAACGSTASGSLPRHPSMGGRGIARPDLSDRPEEPFGRFRGPYKEFPNF